MSPTSTRNTNNSDSSRNANNPNGGNNGNRQQTKMLQWQRQLSGYESSSPEDNCEDEEVDETFVALQKLLKALNRTTRQSAQVVPTNASSVSDPAAANNRAMGIARNNDVAVDTTPLDELTPQDQRRLSQEEILESRRQERERFRHTLFSKQTRPRSRHTAHHYLQSEDEDEDDEPVSSVESTISNRVINGSFSRLNVHVISRDRWAREEVERLPIVLLPENGRVVSPEENPKLNVCFTNEFMELHDDLMAQLTTLPEMSDHSRLLTPPQSTWYIQMRDMDGIHC